MINLSVRQWDRERTHLRGNKSEIAGVGTGFGTAFPPIDEAKSVLGIPRHAEGVDERGSEDGLLEAVRTSLAVNTGKDEADWTEVVGVFAEIVEEFAEFGPLLRRRFAPQHPVEEAAEDAELRLLLRHIGRQWSISKFFWERKKKKKTPTTVE